MRKACGLGIALVLLGSSATSSTITFEGLADGSPVSISVPTSVGRNASVFGGIALIDSDDGGSGLFANEPSGSTVWAAPPGTSVGWRAPGPMTFWYSYTGTGPIGSCGYEDDGTLEYCGIGYYLPSTTPASGDPTGGANGSWAPLNVGQYGRFIIPVDAGATLYIDNVMVPEPAADTLLGFGLVTLAWRRGRGARILGA